MSEVEQLAQEQFNTFKNRLCEMLSEIEEEHKSAFIQGYAKRKTEEKFRNNQCKVVVEHFEAYGQCRDSRRIASFEKENAELKDKLKNLESVAEVRLANWQKYKKECAELKSECQTCVYTDSPCLPSDYGKDKDNYCDHFKSVFEENKELKEQIEKISEELQAIKTSYDNSKDKTPIKATGAEYRLLCDIENLIEEWEIK